MIYYTKIQPEEAEAFFQLMKQIDQETDYMLYLPDERQMDIPKLENMIQSIQDNGLLLGARNEIGKLVGYISLEGNHAKKIRHSAYIVIGILADYQGQGVGTQLFTLADKWAKRHKIHRLELTVMHINQAGLHLYQKMGFEIEGTKRDSIWLNGQYVDEYYMAKLI